MIVLEKLTWRLTITVAAATVVTIIINVIMIVIIVIILDSCGHVVDRKWNDVIDDVVNDEIIRVRPNAAAGGRAATRKWSKSCRRGRRHALIVDVGTTSRQCSLEICRDLGAGRVSESVEVVRVEQFEAWFAYHDDWSTWTSNVISGVTTTTTTTGIGQRVLLRVTVYR